MERYSERQFPSDKSQWANTSFAFTRQLDNMLHLARVIVKGARMRDESRGAHYKPDFTDRNDEKFLKTTMASFVDGAPKIDYAEVDTQYISRRGRGFIRRASAPSECVGPSALWFRSESFGFNLGLRPRKLVSGRAFVKHEFLEVQ